MKKLFFDWGISDHAGWGVYGSNLLLLGMQDPRFEIFPLDWPPSFLYPINPIAAIELDRYLGKRNQPLEIKANDVLLTALGNSVKKKNTDVDAQEIGVIFFEANPLPKESISSLNDFKAIITGSTWNQQQLERCGVKSELVIQGVDTDLFRPLNKKFLKDHFVVFSGGKLEFRKGQDIALKAFSIFARNHKDALLISCWRSPWENQVSSTINHSYLCTPLDPQKDMGKAITNWVLSNGVKPEQHVDLGAISNQLMPEVFREVDLAVFPNRAEGGTNLVAMEAISAGVHCAISSNTGHLDLIKHCQCTPLTQQSPVLTHSKTPCIDWGESSVDELVEVLESAYQARLEGLNKSTISSSIQNFTWGNSIKNLLDIAHKI